MYFNIKKKKEKNIYINKMLYLIHNKRNIINIIYEQKHSNTKIILYANLFKFNKQYLTNSKINTFYFCK